jgi:hypothetical protein
MMVKSQLACLDEVRHECAHDRPAQRMQVGFVVPRQADRHLKEEGASYP